MGSGQNDVRFRRRVPKRTHLRKGEAARLLAAAEREAKEAKAAGAIESVRRAREYAVESGEQEDFVRRFEETLRSREGEKP
jgi:regulator of protease activity HflC (stomatin/prohibitin superfamily)